MTKFVSHETKHDQTDLVIERLCTIASTLDVRLKALETIYLRQFPEHEEALKLIFEAALKQAKIEIQQVSEE